MKAKFTQTYVASIKPTGKVFWLTDAGFQNLRLYVGASGVKTWYVGYQGADGRNKSHKLGSADFFTVAEARVMASDLLARLARGENIKKEKPKQALLLGDFIVELLG